MRIMWRHALLLVCLSGCCLAGPLHGIKRNVPAVMREQENAAAAESPAPEPIAPEFPDMPSTLTLPSNATSIRTEITDNFSCDDKVYGYYADVDNECQIFHVCLPVTYADGKENTFRWSFICPEETIFSQDSFTCMRREDMSIECADSVRYYELNSNFGMAEVQSIAEPAEEQTSQVEPMQPEVQQPVMSEEQEPETAPAPTPALAQPKPMKDRPVKLPKPNRRKPQQKPQTRPQQDLVMNPANKQPAIIPLRKMPNLGNKAAAKPVEDEAKPIIEAASKPLPQRYKKRPSATKNSEKAQAELPAPPFKVEMAFKASNPDSYKRKRPTFAHKTNEADNKEPGKVAFVELVSEPVVVEPLETAVKIESNINSVPVPAKEEAEKIKELVQVAEETPSEAIQEVEDAEPQASETGEVFVAPETAGTELTSTLAHKKDEERLAEEEIGKNEELLSQEATNAKETAPVSNAETEGITKNEADVEIPAIVSEIVQNVPAVEPLKETSNPEELAEQPAEVDDQSIGASEPAALGVVPIEAIATNENTEEGLPALPALEELEEQKPANAVESLPATPEMEEQDPIVQQAFTETDNHMQSVGGFKPVDPELAAEAEALLSDFVSALKSDAPIVEPLITLPNEVEAVLTSVEKEDVKMEAGEPQEGVDKNLESENAPIKSDADSIEPAKEEQPMPSKLAEDITSPDKDTQVQEVAIVEDAPMLKYPITNSFHGSMYHIPVKVIQTPYEEESIMKESQNSEEGAKKVEESPSEVEHQKETEIQSEAIAPNQADQTDDAKLEDVPAAAALSEAVGSVDNKADAAQPDAPESFSVDEVESEANKSTAPAAYKPISIDDIVELVKERLDQTPTAEKGTPMELVMKPANADKPVELKFSTQQKGIAAQEESAEQTPAEDIIFPIYHRLSEAADSEAKAPETIVVEEPSAVVKEIEKSPEETTATKSIAAPNVLMVDQASQTDAQALNLNVDKATTATTTNTKTETIKLPVKEAESPAAAETLKEKDVVELAAIGKANRAFRSRSLAKAKLDPRKRRFLFKADAS